MKFPASYGNWTKITTFVLALHLTLSWDKLLQSTNYCIPALVVFLSKIHFNIVLPSRSASSKMSPSCRFRHNNPACIFPLRIRFTGPANKSNICINHSKGTAGNKTNTTRFSFSAATHKTTSTPKSLGSLLREPPLAVFIPRTISPIETGVEKKLELLSE